jgi:hypothetical protein
LLTNFGLSTKNAEASRSPGDWLNQDFWDNYSNDDPGNIINALYGAESPYIKYWTGTCTPSSVEYINSIPSTIDANTIYVLNGASYTTSSTIDMADCSALVSK